MLLTKKSPRSYIGLYQKSLYKILYLLLTPPPLIILPKPPLMQQRLRLGQVEQCSMILKNLRPSTLVSAHFPNALPMQQLDDLRVSCRGLSYAAVLLPSATITKETFHCDNRFGVVCEDVSSEGLHDKYPEPPPSEIQNSTAPPSATGDPIEAGVFDASTWTEDIAPDS